MKSSPILALALFFTTLFTASLPANCSAAAPRTSVTGHWEWSMVPPFTGAGEIITLPSGNVLLRNVEAAGPFSFSGEGIEIDAIIRASINGNLDETLSGPVFGLATLTANVDGEETVIFAGPFVVDTIGLLSTGVGLLHGRGPFEGTVVHFEFEEIPPADAYTFTGYFLRPSHH